MSSNFGDLIRVTIFGESHGPAIGLVMDSPPVGYEISEELVLAQMKRRAPGQDATATSRVEADIPEFLSGLLDGKTTGAPLACIIRNTNTHSGDYDNIVRCPRPSHADYAASVRYDGNNDIRGGGHFSGRLTAPLVIAGSIAKQILSKNGIAVVGHVLQIGKAKDSEFCTTSIDDELAEKLSNEYFATISDSAKEKMYSEIMAAKSENDSIGGAVEIAVTGLPVGVGDPMFGGVENVISSAVYGVPAVKAVSFGAGFDFAGMRGSEANDQMYVDDNGEVKCLTNNCGGITGGITNSMPVIIKAYLKPTPSIGRPQHTVDVTDCTNSILEIKGRHDPCIVPRALPAIESAVALAILNLLARGGRI